MRKPSQATIKTNLDNYNNWRTKVQREISKLETPGAYSALCAELREIGNRIYAGELFETTQALVDHVHMQIRRCKQGYYSHVDGKSWFLA
jgi:hypothetical protein